MNRLMKFALTWLLSAPLFAAPLFHVLITRPTPDTWRIDNVRDVQVQSHHRVRVWPNSREEKLFVQRTSYDRLSSVVLDDAPTLVKSPDSILFLQRPETWEVVLPDGYSIAAPTSAQSLWSTAMISFYDNTHLREHGVVPFREFFALVPVSTNSADALADFVLDQNNFFDHGADPAFHQQMSLLKYVVALNQGRPAIGRFSDYIYTRMKQPLDRMQRDQATYAELQRAVQFASVSQEVFADDPHHLPVRRAIFGYQAKLGRDHAVAEALNAGGQPDALIHSYPALEQYEQAFAGMREARRSAYVRSASIHYENARRAFAQGDRATAAEQLKLALRLVPSFDEAQALADRLEIQTPGAAQSANLAAFRNINLPLSNDASAASTVQLQRYLALAERMIESGNFPEARHQLELASTLDSGSIEIRMTRARLYQATGDLHRALSELDEYDSASRATSNNVGSADSIYLRSLAVHDLGAKSAALKQDIAIAMRDRRFDRVLAFASTGLREVDAQDAEFQYFAGISSAILRREAEAEAHLQRFLAVSDGLQGDPSKRQMARQILALLAHPPNFPDGPDAAWFSRAPLDRGTLYDPVTGLFQPRIASIRGFDGTNVLFRWSADQLLSVHTWHSFPSFSLAAPHLEITREVESPEGSFYFHYDAANRQVVDVTRQPGLVAIETGPRTRELIDRSLSGTVPESVVVRPANSEDAWPERFVVLNSARVNPIVEEAVTGAPSAVAFAPNAYFQPFVWDGIHKFQVRYDGEGRVRTAHEFYDDNPPLEFEWYGKRLLSVSQRSGDGQVAYRRTLHYTGDLLDSETIWFRGKTSRIRYKYDTDRRLIESNFGGDPSLGVGYRKAVFQN